MMQLLMECLSRQAKGMMLLTMIQEEVFSRLGSADPQIVSGLELSIQELIRQLLAEKMLLRRLVEGLKPGAKRVAEIMELADEEQRETIEKLLQLVDQGEQKSSIQAAKNARLVQGLLEQNSDLLQFFQKQVQPRKNNAYTARGRYTTNTQEARLISGRL